MISGFHGYAALNSDREVYKPGEKSIINMDFKYMTYPESPVTYNKILLHSS